MPVFGTEGVRAASKQVEPKAKPKSYSKNILNSQLKTSFTMQKQLFNAAEHSERLAPLNSHVPRCMSDDFHNVPHPLS
eukprot:200314-Amphidinium_carterae.1